MSTTSFFSEYVSTSHMMHDANRWSRKTHYIHVYIHLLGSLYSDDYWDIETNLLIITFHFTKKNQGLFYGSDSFRALVRATTSVGETIHFFFVLSWFSKGSLLGLRMRSRFTISHVVKTNLLIITFEIQLRHRIVFRSISLIGLFLDDPSQAQFISFVHTSISTLTYAVVVTCSRSSWSLWQVQMIEHLPKCSLTSIHAQSSFDHFKTSLWFVWTRCYFAQQHSVEDYDVYVHIILTDCMNHSLPFYASSLFTTTILYMSSHLICIPDWIIASVNVSLLYFISFIMFKHIETQTLLLTDWFHICLPLTRNQSTLYHPLSYFIIYVRMFIHRETLRSVFPVVSQTRLQWEWLRFLFRQCHGWWGYGGWWYISHASPPYHTKVH